MLRQIEKLLLAVLENEGALRDLPHDWQYHAERMVEQIKHRLLLENCIKLLDNND